METIISLLGGSGLGSVGVLVALTMVIVEVLKNIVPKSFPTKVLTLIVAIVVGIAALVISGGIGVIPVIEQVLGSFVVAFISMNGFDGLKELVERITKGEDDGGAEEA